MEAENLFSQYTYNSWVPEDLRQEFQTLDSAIARLETAPSLEAAFAVFWTLFEPATFSDPDLDTIFLKVWEGSDFLSEWHFDWNTNADVAYRRVIGDPENWGGVPNISVVSVDMKNRKNSEARLAELVDRLRPELIPDEPVNAVDAWIFAHVAVAFALELERIDKASSDKSEELFGQALVMITRVFPENNRNYEAQLATALVISNNLVESILWIHQFQKTFQSGSYMQALECLWNITGLCGSADSLTRRVESTTVRDWLEGQEGDEARPCPGIEVIGSPSHLIALRLLAQTAADAFEQLIEEPDNDTDWRRVSRICEHITYIWEKLPYDFVYSKSQTDESEIRDFWIYAKGVATLKISPNALAQTLYARMNLKVRTGCVCTSLRKHGNFYRLRQRKPWFPPIGSTNTEMVDGQSYSTTFDTPSEQSFMSVCGCRFGMIGNR